MYIYVYIYVYINILFGPKHHTTPYVLSKLELLNGTISDPFACCFGSVRGWCMVLANTMCTLMSFFPRRHT